MIRLVRELRLIPIVLVATGCLFALKLIGLFFNGGYVLNAPGSTGEYAITIPLSAPSRELAPQTVTLDNLPPSTGAKQSWMREMFGFPDVTGSIGSKPAPSANSPSITGSAAAPKPAGKDAPKDAPKGPPSDAKAAPPGNKNEPPQTKPAVINGTVVPLDGSRPISAAERAILERLHERRQELDKRARELDMRENMLKEAEQRLDARMNELKALEASGGPGSKKKEQAMAGQLKNLATMYENMKPKEAAKIFDRLDMKVLIEMSTQINPRRMSEILAQMSPEAAERLTMELANRATGEKSNNPASLPKIVGRPNGT